jgi:thymidylate synthase
MVSLELIRERNSFPNAWARAVNEIMKNGQEITFGGKIKDKDQYERKVAKDMDIEIVLEGMALKEAIAGVLHPKFPTKEQVKVAYLKEWERNYDWRKQGFTYCYEDRAEAYQGYKMNQIELQHAHFQSYQVPPISTAISTVECIPITIDQWKLAKEDLAQQISTGIQSNRNIIDIGNPSIDRFEIPDSPPCLRDIWFRYEGNGKASVKTLWRSRDLFTAWMTNVVGLLSAVMREVIIPNNCEIVQYVDKNHSIHIYRGDWDDALKIKQVHVNPQIMR